MAQKVSQESAAVGTNLLDLVERFEMAIRSNAAYRIEDFLATCPVDYQKLASMKRRNLLLALIQIDVGFCCRRTPKDVNRCFAPDYVKRFPELQSVAPGLSDVFEAELDAKEGLAGFDALAFRSHFIPKKSKVAGATHDTVAPRNEFDTVPSSKYPAHAGIAAGNTPRSEWSFLSPPKADDELGRLGPFRVLKALGAGGMGMVFLAEDPALRRKVALKVMQQGLGQDPMARKRFLREARAAAALQHDYIVTIYQVGEANGVPFLAMQLLNGESLEQRLQREKTLPLADILRIGRQVAEGLAAAHEQGLIHRDIKPANIWLETKSGTSNSAAPVSQDSRSSASYRVKILDFGLRGLFEPGTRLTNSGAVIGTPAYMAPEQAAGKAVDKRCDLFSLGCTLFHLGWGKSPFLRRDTLSTLLSIARDHPKRLIELKPDLPLGLSDLVAQLLAKDPQERPLSCQDVANFLSSMETSANSGSVSKTSGEKKKVVAREPPSSPAFDVTLVPTPQQSGRPKMASDTMKAFCPRCGEQVTIRLTVQGKTVRCPKCQQSFQAPTLALPQAKTLRQTPTTTKRRFLGWTSIKEMVIYFGLVAAVGVVSKAVFPDFVDSVLDKFIPLSGNDKKAQLVPSGTTAKDSKGPAEPKQGKDQQPSTATVPGQSEAENLFNAMEKAIVEAKSLRVVAAVESQSAIVHNSTFTFVVAETNRASLKSTVRLDEKGPLNTTFQLISDGKSFVAGETLTNAKSRQTPSDLNEKVLKGISRVGSLMTLAALSANPAEKNPEIDLKKTITVSEFRFGKKEAVGKKQAQIVEYKCAVGSVEFPPLTIQMKLWIDTETNQPLKRHVNAENERIVFAESYTTFAFNPKVTAKTFLLPNAEP